MDACSKYIERSEAELKAADLAPCREIRLAHLEQAYLYAKLAAAKRKESPVFLLSR
jgi:hypothetical protein